MSDEVQEEVPEVPETPVEEVPAPPVSLDTASPAGNFSTRDNIVPDGPGTVADFL